MAIHRLTAQYIGNLTCPDEGQEVVWDPELRGFGLVISRTAKAYIAQRDVHGRTIRVTLGRHGVMTCMQARAAARQALATLARGADPREERRRQEAQSRTLAMVFDDYTAARKAFAPGPSTSIGG
jgi:hypothetical protein